MKSWKGHNYEKIFLLVVCTLGFVINTPVHAATPKDVSENLPQISVNSEQIVQVLPEGGFIFKKDGSGDFDTSIVASNNATLMTYDQYLALEEIDNSFDYAPFPYSFRATSPEIATYNPKILADGESYVSSRFQKKGWRFSELKFKAADGTGTWLLWYAIGDGGCVGNEYEAYRTYQTGTRVARATIETGQRQYVNGNGSWLFFYTYNPVPGSQYVVANQ